MANRFLLTCESTADLPYQTVRELADEILFYTYCVDGEEYPDEMQKTPDALPRFYAMLRAGKLPTTSQITEFRYLEFFEPLVRQGDLLHIAFGSGMTPSVRNAEAAAAKLREKYPDREILVVDSLCSSVGYGLLVREAARLREAGQTPAQVAQWLTEHRRELHHQFFSTDMKFFRRSGRVSGPMATIATVLSICPLMRLDSEGRIFAYSKTRGIKNAVDATVKAVKEHLRPDPSGEYACTLGHSDCPALAAQVKEELERQIPALAGRVQIEQIGTVIASHCGPGTVAAFFWGDER